MPLISTNNSEQHEKLKIYCIRKKITVGNMTDHFIAAAMILKLGDMTLAEVLKLKEKLDEFD